MENPNNVLVLLEEENVISLRTAYVQDGGDLVALRLMPAWLDSSIPTGRRRYDLSWATQDCAWLYRRMRPPAEEAALMHALPCLAQDVRPMALDGPPQFKLVWTDSGHGLALYLNGEPWAFIDEDTHKGYSKGMLRAKFGDCPWDQELFERIFKP